MMWEAVRAIRRVFKARRFAMSVIASVAIATAPILVTTNVFEAGVLRELAVRAPADLLTLRSVRSARGAASGATMGISFPDYQDLRLGLPRDKWHHMVAWKVIDVSTVIQGHDRPLRVDLVSGDYFQLARVRFIWGRALAEDEDGVVITRSLWRKLQQAQRADVLTIINRSYRVIGVVDDGFRGFVPDEGADAWVQLTTLPSLSGESNLLTYRELEDLSVFVQPVPHSAAALIQAIRSIEIGLSDYQERRRFGWKLEASPAQPSFLERLRSPGGLQSAVPVCVLFCLLLVAATNVANLFAVRAAARTRENQIRLALGLSRSRLLILSSLEPAVLTLVGLSVGLVYGQIALRYLRDTPAMSRWDLSVTPFSLTSVFVAALLFAAVCALVPAIELARLKETDVVHHGQGITGRDVGRIQKAYLVLQFTFALGFAAIAVQVASAVFEQARVDVGFNTGDLLVITDIMGAAGRGEDQKAADYDRVTSSLLATPGVTSVSASVSHFFNGYRMTIRGIAASPTGESRLRYAYMDIVGPRYFATLGVPLLAGREFDARDGRGQSTRAILVNESLAKRIAGDSSPVGRTLFEAGKYPMQIVGVVPNIRTTAAADVPPAYYRSLTQSPVGSFVAYVRVRAVTPALIGKIRTAITNELPDNAGRLEIHSAAEEQRNRDAPAELMLWVSGSLAAVAMLIAAVGLYSVAAFAAQTRRQEYAIRAAIGASGRQLSTEVMLGGLRWTSLAAVLSVPFVWGGMRVAGATVQGARPIPVATLFIVIAAYCVLAVAALVRPAQSAASADPSDAMRVT